MSYHREILSMNSDELAIDLLSPRKMERCENGGPGENCLEKMKKREKIRKKRQKGDRTN